MSNSDAIWLAFNHAAREIGVPEKETKKILAFLLQYREDHEPWPKGFMA